MKQKNKYSEKLIVIVSILLVFASAVIFYINNSSNKQAEIQSYTSMLKLVIKQGEELTNTVKISNPYKAEQEFSIEIKNLYPLVTASETSFSLQPLSEKNIDIKVSNKDLDKSPGIYPGLITISSEKSQESIPVIIEIQTPEIIFATNLDVSPEHKDLYPGSNTVTTLRFYNLNDTRTHNIEVTCSIQDFSGNTIASEKESIAVTTEATISKTMPLPKNIQEGKYVFTAITKYEDSLSTSSYIFSVYNQDKFSLFLNAKTFFIIVVIIIVLFLFFILFLLTNFIRDRNQLFIELKKQQGEEIKQYSQKVDSQKQVFISKLKTKQEKQKALKQFKTIKKQGLKTIKKKQKQQKQLFKKLKKEKKLKKLENKLRIWKKQGYDIKPLISQKNNKKQINIQSIIKDWKKQGYDTSVITR